MESRFKATTNGSCTELYDRIIESFIGLISDMMVSRSLCQPRHRCRIRKTFVYCSDDDLSDASSSAPAVGNLTVDFVLETELKPNSGGAVTASDQRDLVYSLDDVFAVLFELVSDGEMTWSTHGSQIVAVSLDSALVQFDMENCSAGQIFNDRDADVPTCRECLILSYFSKKYQKCAQLMNKWRWKNQNRKKNKKHHDNTCHICPISTDDRITFN